MHRCVMHVKGLKDISCPFQNLQVCPRFHWNSRSQMYGVLPLLLLENFGTMCPSSMTLANSHGSTS
jgi:hypothetical protein